MRRATRSAPARSAKPNRCSPCAQREGLNVVGASDGVTRTTRSRAPRAKGTTAQHQHEADRPTACSAIAEEEAVGRAESPPTLASSEAEQRLALHGRACQTARCRLLRAGAADGSRRVVRVRRGERHGGNPAPGVNRPCSSPANESPDRRAGSRRREVPVGRGSLFDACRCSRDERRAGDTGSSPAIASRGEAIPPIPSRTTAAIAERASGDVVAKR